MNGKSTRTDQLIGSPEIQAEAVRVLELEGPLSYDELKEHLGHEHATMQKLMRHLVHYNGLAKTEPTSTGGKIYKATPNKRIQPYITDTLGNQS